MTMMVGEHKFVGFRIKGFFADFFWWATIVSSFLSKSNDIAF
jgi:hypothetical protein